MTDLVKRLRSWPYVYPDDRYKPEGHLYKEAAERIEELGAKLAKLEAAAQKAVGHITGYGEASTARIELRTTLEELTGETNE